MYLLHAPVEKFGKLPTKAPLITDEVLFTNNIAYCTKYFWKKHHILMGCRDITPGWMKRARQNRDLFNILFIATGGFGDVMWYMPFMRAVREKYPRSRILVATEERTMPVFANVPYADLCVKDEFWNLQALIRNAHEVYDFGGIATMLKKEMKLDPIDATFLDGELPPPKDRKLCRPWLVLTIDEGKQAEALLKRNGIDVKKDVIVSIALESSTPNRNWPFQYVLELTQRLTAEGKKVVWLSESKDFGNTYFFNCPCGWEFKATIENPPDTLAMTCPVCKQQTPHKEIKNPDGVANLGGKTHFREAFAIIAQSHLFIGPNSGLMVAATSLETPTIGLFGAFNPKIRTKYYDRFAYIWGRPSCSPCEKHWTECPKGYPAPCMRVITVDMVYNKCQEFLQRYKRTFEERRAIT